jgi:farnesyl-diphosphate farnesyltransferase
LWPVLIGLETLLLLVHNDHWLDPAQVSKVQRNKVYQLIAGSVPLVVSDALVRRWTGSLIARIEARLAL